VLKGYRTIFVNSLAMAAIMAQICLDLAYSQEVQFFLTDEQMPYFMAAVIAANIVLRIATTTPVGKKS